MNGIINLGRGLLENMGYRFLPVTQHAKNAFYLERGGIREHAIYYKIRNSEDKNGFWGLTDNILRHLNKQGIDYTVILFTNDYAYTLKKFDIYGLMAARQPAQDGDYKLVKDDLNIFNCGVYKTCN